MSNILLYSGGADSTLMLEELIRTREEVVAVNITQHSSISRKQSSCQYIATDNYSDLRDPEDYPNFFIEEIHIHEDIKVEADYDNFLGQPLIFLCCIAPYVKNNDIVYFGWRQGEGIYQNIERFDKAFHALMDLKGIKATYRGIEEYRTKADVLEKLQEYNIPDNCWFSCENPNHGKPCRICRKCEEIDESRRELNRRNCLRQGKEY